MKNISIKVGTLLGVLFLAVSLAGATDSGKPEKLVVRAGSREYVLSYKIHLHGGHRDSTFSDLRITSPGLADLVVAYPAREKDDEEFGDLDGEGTTFFGPLHKLNSVHSDFFHVAPVSKTKSLLIFFGWGYAGDPAVMWAISLGENGAKVVFRHPAFLVALTGIGEPDSFRCILQKTLGECRCETPRICTYEPRFVYQFQGDALVVNDEESERYNQDHSATSSLQLHPAQNLFTVELKDKTLALPEPDAMRYCKPADPKSESRRK